MEAQEKKKKNAPHGRLLVPSSLTRYGCRFLFSFFLFLFLFLALFFSPLSPFLFFCIFRLMLTPARSPRCRRRRLLPCFFSRLFALFDFPFRSFFIAFYSLA
jgi:hypothetical protein